MNASDREPRRFSSEVPDFGGRADDYRRHRAGFPPSFFEALERRGLLALGTRALDLGTGTGSIALGLASRGCTVTALDISIRLLDVARTSAREARLAVRFVEASAEKTGLEAASFDLVTAGQCWHWFDRPKAAVEAKRLLANGGALVVAHFDWITMPGSAVADSMSVVEEFGEFPKRALVGVNGTYPIWLDELASEGFAVESFSFDESVRYTHEAWKGRLRASAALCTLGEPVLTEFDARLDAKLAARPGGKAAAFDVPHRVYVVIARNLAR